jgi:uncharacterized protein YlbG (UPF0298 family)
LNLRLFQLFFINRIALPGGKSLKQIFDFYNDSFGTPQKGSVELLQERIKTIKNCFNYNTFFSMIKFEEHTEEEIAQILRISSIRSQLKQYHFVKNISESSRSLVDIDYREGEQDNQNEMAKIMNSSFLPPNNLLKIKTCIESVSIPEKSLKIFNLDQKNNNN